MLVCISAVQLYTGVHMSITSFLHGVIYMKLKSLKRA